MSRILKRQAVDADVLTLARQRVSEVFDRFDTVVVSFSGGKDSTPCLYLAMEEARRRGLLPLEVIFCDEEAIPYETEAYCRRLIQHFGTDLTLRWYCLPVQHRNACSRSHPHWWPWAPESESLWCRPLPPEAITDLHGFPTEPERRWTWPGMNAHLYGPEYGNVAIVLGVRAQESLTRYRAVAQRTVDNWLVQQTGQDESVGGQPCLNHWKAYPIYDWQTEDIWTAISSEGWDYNRAYDVMEMMGIPHDQQRLGPAFGEEPLRGFHQFRVCFPDIWDKMLDRVPGVGAALRYSRTELYGYQEKPQKPPDMSWPEFLTHYIDQYPPEARHAVADNIRRLIRLHVHRTPDPILYGVPHPLSGVYWKQLLSMAMRGDFKRRRFQGTQQARVPEEISAAWTRYNAARAEAGL